MIDPNDNQQGDGIHVAVVSNATSGMQYKYIVDYADNNYIDDASDWKVDPANPELDSGDYNSVIP